MGYVGNSGTSNPFLIAGCGVLQDEVHWLVEKNNWMVEEVYLQSSCDITLDLLEKKLKNMIQKNIDRRPLLLYGECHPRMNGILDKFHCIRIPGNNCIEFLLGHDIYNRELEAGAYFLTKGWLNGIMTHLHRVFGRNREVIREIYHACHKYLLCINTPCSLVEPDYAAEVAEYLDLPLHWHDTDLENLEKLIQMAILSAGDSGEHRE